MTGLLAIWLMRTRMGSKSAASYARARLGELHAALALAGVPADALLALGVPDQEVACELVQTVDRLTELFTSCGIAVAITHSYEGGHPDHDATAFAVHAAAAVLRARHWPIGIIEVPLYHRGPGGMVRQHFVANIGGELTLRLSAPERFKKQQMVAVHATQAGVIGDFQLDFERFRQGPAYDFCRLPNAGRVLYDAYDWGIKSSRWQTLVRDAKRRLELESLQ